MHTSMIFIYSFSTNVTIVYLQRRYLSLDLIRLLCVFCIHHQSSGPALGGLAGYFNWNVITI